MLNRRRHRSKELVKFNLPKTRRSNRWFAAVSTGWRPGSTSSNVHTTKTTTATNITSNISRTTNRANIKARHRV